MHHSDHSISHIGITSAIQPKTITYAIYSKYIYINNGDTTPFTTDGVLKIFLEHINIKTPMLPVIYYLG